MTMMIYYYESQGSRVYAIYDCDGSTTLTGKPTMVSTRRNFWAVKDHLR